jgi:hypothetical protein
MKNSKYGVRKVTGMKSFKMRTKLQTVLMSLATGGLVTGCTITIQPNGAVAPQPAVIVEEPGPVMFPETYVWDGYEYVGVVGDRYFYLGPGNVWLVCEPFRLERFHGWERYHQDWREHAIRNTRYRVDRNGRRAPPKKEHDEH